MTTTTNRCKGRNKRGEPCGGYAVEGSSYCFAHDPALIAERKQARAKGGKARHGRTVGAATGSERVISLRSIDECLALLEEEAAELLQLERSVSRTRALVSLVSTAGSLLAEHEFETRLTRLEEAIHVKQAA